MLGGGIRRRLVPQLDVAVSVEHDVAVEVGDTSGALDDVLELLVGDLRVEIGDLRQGREETIEVIEAVAIHQPLHLVLEDGVEGRTEDAAEHVALGEAADPQVDAVEAAGAGDEEVVATELSAVGSMAPDIKLCASEAVTVCDTPSAPTNVVFVSVASASSTAWACATSPSNEYAAMKFTSDFGVDHAVTELAPAVVGLQQVELDLGVCLGGRTVGVGALGDERVVELLPDLVQRRDAEITATRDIDRGEVERLAEQALLQGRGDELVGLVADLVRHAERNGARADFGELAGIEEGRGERVVRNGAGDVEAAVGGLRLDGVDRLAQLRVAEAERGLRVLEADVGIDIGVVGDELRQVRRHEARVLVDGDVLIFQSRP